MCKSYHSVSFSLLHNKLSLNPRTTYGSTNTASLNFDLKFNIS